MNGKSTIAYMPPLGIRVLKLSSFPEIYSNSIYAPTNPDTLDEARNIYLNVDPSLWAVRITKPLISQSTS